VSKILVFVEGATEEAFVNQILSAFFKGRRHSPTPRLTGHPRREGGIREYDIFKNELRLAMEEDKYQYFSTMFDFYGLPESYPGRRGVIGDNPRAKASSVENAIKEDLQSDFPEFNVEDRVIPYIQMHEFEALLFSDPNQTARAIGANDQANNLRRIVEEYQEPEAIDDGEKTAPSKRIKSLIPWYNKPTDGLVAVRRLGLDRIRENCPHFNDWVTHLESL